MTSGPPTPSFTLSCRARVPQARAVANLVATAEEQERASDAAAAAAAAARSEADAAEAALAALEAKLQREDEAAEQARHAEGAEMVPRFLFLRETTTLRLK